MGLANEHFNSAQLLQVVDLTGGGFLWGEGNRSNNLESC